MKNVLLILLSITSFNSFGQYSSTYQTNIVFQNAPLGSITSLPPAQPETVGTYYLYEEYLQADIYLKDSTKLDDVAIRLDLKDNAIEVKFNEAVKLLPVSKVISVTLFRNGATEDFVNGGLISSVSKLYRDQLLKVLIDGETTLLCSTKTQLKEAQRSQNPMLGTNREDNEIVQHKVYVIIKDKDYVTTSTGKSNFRKDMITLYGPEREAMIKKVNPKSEVDLVLLVNELNRPKS